MHAPRSNIARFSLLFTNTRAVLGRSGKPNEEEKELAKPSYLCNNKRNRDLKSIDRASWSTEWDVVVWHDEVKEAKHKSVWLEYSSLLTNDPFAVLVTFIQYLLAARSMRDFLLALSLFTQNTNWLHLAGNIIKMPIERQHTSLLCVSEKATRSPTLFYVAVCPFGCRRPYIYDFDFGTLGTWER